MNKEVVMRKLQKNGGRITKQRELLIDIILENQCASCKEIYIQASLVDKSIGIATVYRFLNTLEEIGIISRSCFYQVLD